jgi:CRISPR-associated protein Cas2
MRGRKLHLVAYDVADPKRLARALKVCKQFATGGQKSVFECWMTEGERRHLLSSMRTILSDVEDRFFLVRLDPRCKPHVLGLAVPPAGPVFFYQD